jgi:hypothetical protein
MGGDKDLP